MSMETKISASGHGQVRGPSITSRGFTKASQSVLFDSKFGHGDLQRNTTDVIVEHSAVAA
jgi:hypothetical protein